MASTRMEIDVRRVPEVLFEMRRSLADMVREVAQDEEPAVAARLREIAALFEVGQTNEGMR